MTSYSEDSKITKIKLNQTESQEFRQRKTTLNIWPKRYLPLVPVKTGKYLDFFLIATAKKPLALNEKANGILPVCVC